MDILLIVLPTDHIFGSPHMHVEHLYTRGAHPSVASSAVCPHGEYLPWIPNDGTSRETSSLRPQIMRRIHTEVIAHPRQCIVTLHYELLPNALKVILQHCRTALSNFLHAFHQRASLRGDLWNVFANIIQALIQFEFEFCSEDLVSDCDWQSKNVCMCQ